jgi:antagonist of KipI
MLYFLDGGLCTTVQDHGRPGYYSVGIPPSGAMDNFAHSLANALVGNPTDSASLEATLLGPTIRFEKKGLVAITGADMSPTLNGARASMWEAFRVGAGDTLQLGYATSGCRAFVGVAGGIDVPVVLGSRSTYTPAFLGGHRGRKISVGVQLATAVETDRDVGFRLEPEFRPTYASEVTLAVVLGPQDDLFADEGIATFLGSRYAVSARSDRMACRLEGPAPVVRERVRSIDEGEGLTDIIEDGNAIGAIQIAGGIEPIIMLRDAPSTGAYAKIACVVSADLDTIAQAKPRDGVRFRRITVERGQDLLMECRQRLAAALESVRQ